MSLVTLSSDYLDRARVLANARLKYFNDTDYEAQFVGAMGEFGACTWLEESGIKVGPDGVHAAFSFKEHKRDADLLVNGNALRIEIKSNAWGNRRYRVKDADAGTIKAKADVVLWCEVEFGGEPECDHGETMIHSSCEARILGWAPVGDAFNAPREGVYRFMPAGQVRLPRELLEKIRQTLA